MQISQKEGNSATILESLKMAEISSDLAALFIKVLRLGIAF